MCNFILERNVQELVSMDINELKNLFINEINELSFLGEEERNERIKFMIYDLFKIQPNSSLIGHIYHNEQRLFADLISIPEFYNNSYIRAYLKKDDFSLFFPLMSNKINLLRKIFDFYDKATFEQKEKFDYLFRSSASVGVSLIHEDVDLKFDIICNLLNYFEKEDFSEIVKFSFDDRKTILSFSNNQVSHKELFVISAMNKKMGLMIGNTNNFLSDISWCYSSNDNFKFLLEDFYDKFVGSNENEENFLESVLGSKDFIPLMMLMESIVSRELSTISFDGIDNYDDFVKKRSSIRAGYTDIILNTDIENFTSRGGLDLFKKAFLYNVYGMKINEVSEMVKVYGEYLEETFEDISDSSKSVFFILKALKDIDSLSFRDDNCLEKIRFLQLSYQEYVKNNGLDTRNKLYSSVVLDGLFSKMFINTYNDKLLKVDNCSLVEEDDGILVFDSGYNFHVMLTSLKGVYSSYYEKTVNMASKWNTAFNSTNQGISMSCITNENLGVFSLTSPLLGFSYIPDYSLNTMGISDIYTNVEHFNLRDNEIGDLDYKRFVPASIIDDETRYGYNEFLIDRFLKNDKDNMLKIQPSYVVCYKFSDNYKGTNLYKNSLKVAKDFNIPIVLIDVPKLKDNEKKEILLMQDELLKGNDPKKIKDVLVRYMNNYTGSLVLSDHFFKYGKDFSVLGVGDFLNKVFDKIKGIDDFSLRKQWIDSLEDAYLLEREKFTYARSVRNFGHSVKEFVLGKYKVEAEIFKLRNGLVKDKNPTGLKK